MTLDQHTLRNTRVFNSGLKNRNGSIFRVVVDLDLSQKVLLRRIVEGLLEIGIETEHLQCQPQEISRGSNLLVIDDMGRDISHVMLLYMELLISIGEFGLGFGSSLEDSFKDLFLFSPRDGG